MQAKYYFSTSTTKLRRFFLVGILSFTVPLCGFSQTTTEEEATTTTNRSEVKYKQRHSNIISTGNDLYADGVKIKRDLSILHEIQEERILAMDEIPADDLYEGNWSNQYAHIYNTIKNVPDSFVVNLENFCMPIKEGHVTSNFGPRRRRMHNGIDLKVQVGDTIYAAFDGKVRVKRYERRGYGYYLTVRHHNGLETIYGHLSKFLVEENDVVKAGDPIALGGNTGRSTGSHLHWEFRFLGMAINPRDIVDFDNYVCHRDQYKITTKKVKNNNKYIKGQVIYHRIKKGESLSTIARRYGTTISAIQKKNNMGRSTAIRAGRSLRI